VENSIDYILKDGEINSKYLLKNFDDTYIDSPSVYEPGNIYFYNRGSNAKAATFKNGILEINDSGISTNMFMSYPIQIDPGKKIFVHVIVKSNGVTSGKSSFVHLGIGKVEDSKIKNTWGGALSGAMYGYTFETSAWISADVVADAEFITLQFCDCIYSIDEIVVIR
jgi:hypothetical protein